MANLKEIRIRITSVTSTMQITSAMKMVSAAKLRKAQNAILQIRPYASKLNEILQFLSNVDSLQQDNIFIQNREIKKVLLVVISSNRGLCGAFNANVFKKAIQAGIESFPKQAKANNIDFLVIGKKAGDMLRRKGAKIFETHPEIIENINYENSAKLAFNLIEKFNSKQYDRIDIIYNQFKNAAVQVLTQEQFLPIKVDSKVASSSNIDFIFEPSKEVIFSKMIYRSLAIQFHKAVLDSIAAEHGARMTAMHKATDNAGELIRELKLKYNKERQSAITKEITEIVGGANALKG